MLSGAAAGSGMERPRERRLKEAMQKLLLPSPLFNSKLLSKLVDFRVPRFLISLHQQLC